MIVFPGKSLSVSEYSIEFLKQKKYVNISFKYMFNLWSLGNRPVQCPMECSARVRWIHSRIPGHSQMGQAILNSRGMPEHFHTIDCLVPGLALALLRCRRLLWYINYLPSPGKPCVRGNSNDFKHLKIQGGLEHWRCLRLCLITHVEIIP